MGDKRQTSGLTTTACSERGEPCGQERVGRDARARPPYCPGRSLQALELGVWGAELLSVSPSWQMGITGCVLGCAHFPRKRGTAAHAAAHRAFKGLWNAPGSGSKAPELALANAQLAQTWAVPSPPRGGSRHSNEASRPKPSRGQGLGPKSCEAAVLKVAQARPPGQRDWDMCQVHRCGSPST